MSFWTQQTAITDPKRKYNWFVYFGNLSGQTEGFVPHWAAKSINKPQMTIKDPSHRYLNHTFYFPGAVEWNAIETKLVDPSDPDVSAALASALQTSGYTLPTSDGQQTTISKNGAVSMLGNVKIAQFDGTGKIIETWTLHNAWIADVNFGELAYDDDGTLVEVGLKIRYDWATLETLKGNVDFGTNRTL